MKLLKVRPRNWMGFAACALGILAATPALSQSDYPSQPIRLIVSFAAGGPTDTFARLVASKLEKELGQPIIVENRPGGGSNIGSAFVAKAKPDGYTLLVGTVANTTNMAIYKNPGYDTVRDFAPITQIMSSPSVLVVNNNVPAKTLDELIAYAKSKPGQVSYATSGAGGMQHHASELLRMRSGIDVIHVPYKGAAPALLDVISGNVDMGFKTASGVIPSIQGGKVRPIAVAAKERLAQLPDVPTTAEAGMPGLEADSWNGFFAPAGTPPEIINKIANATIVVLKMPDVRERFAAIAAVPVGSSPEEFSKYVRAEVEKWGKVAREANVQVN